METPNEPFDPCQAEEAAWKKARQELDRLKENLKPATSPLGLGEPLGTSFLKAKATSDAIASGERTVAEAKKARDACRLAHGAGALRGPRADTGG